MTKGGEGSEASDRIKGGGKGSTEGGLGGDNTRKGLDEEGRGGWSRGEWA